MLLRKGVVRFCFLILALAGGAHCRGQAALLMEQPYGLARIFNPTGHVAIYFARICAATPTQLRRCQPGELGSVIARYNGISGYDWIVIPLIPYLYAVENADRVPAHANHKMVSRLRRQYHDRHLLVLGRKLAEGGLIRRGWNQLAGAAYNRRMYALRFSTTAAQDGRLMARLNAAPNRSDFHILWSNCADFAAGILNFYFPGEFERRILPDAGIVTPRQLASRLQQYARRHREVELTLFEIPQIPGYRRPSLENKSVVESVIVSGDIVPVAILAPYAAAGLGADFLIWGRYPLDLRQSETLAPDTLIQLDAAKNDNYPQRQASAAPPKLPVRP